MPKTLIILAVLLLTVACAPAATQADVDKGVSLKIAETKTVTVWFSPGGEHPTENGKVEKIADVTGPTSLMVDPNTRGIYVVQLAADNSQDWYRVRLDNGQNGWVLITDEVKIIK